MKIKLSHIIIAGFVVFIIALGIICNPWVEKIDRELDGITYMVQNAETVSPQKISFKGEICYTLTGLSGMKFTGIMKIGDKEIIYNKDGPLNLDISTRFNRNYFDGFVYGDFQPPHISSYRGDTINFYVKGKFDNIYIHQGGRLSADCKCIFVSKPTYEEGEKLFHECAAMDEVR